jgi:uncharacterized membrane protein
VILPVSCRTCNNRDPQQCQPGWIYLVSSASTLRVAFWNHTRLWLAVVVGIVVYAFLPTRLSLISRILTAWDVGIAVAIPLIYMRMKDLEPGHLRAKYAGEDPSAPVILLTVVVAALLSVVAIVALASGIKSLPPSERAAHGILAAVTIIASWLLVPTMFTLHYADYYYSAAVDRPPLAFPKTREPVFWDFVYFSFTIAVACQTADVATHEPGIRRLVVIHSIISFLFNASIIGFAINVTAGFLQG